MINLKDLEIRALVLNVFGRNFTWLFFRNKKWATNQLSLITDGEIKEELAAFWQGFLLAGRMPSIESFGEFKKRFLQMLVDYPDFLKMEQIKVIGSFVLAGWATKYDKTSKRLITNEELREAIVSTSEALRNHMLWQIWRWLDNDKKVWESQLYEFFKNVWPRHKLVKTNESTDYLFTLIISNPEDFNQRANLIIPFLGKCRFITAGTDREKFRECCKKDAALMLKTLTIVFPEDVSNWYFDTGSLLEYIVDADKKIVENPVFIRLKRLWDSR